MSVMDICEHGKDLPCTMMQSQVSMQHQGLVLVALFENKCFYVVVFIHLYHVNHVTYIHVLTWLMLFNFIQNLRTFRFNVVGTLSLLSMIEVFVVQEPDVWLGKAMLSIHVIIRIMWFYCAHFLSRKNVSTEHRHAKQNCDESLPWY